MVIAKVSLTRKLLSTKHKGSLELAFVLNLSMVKNVLFPMLFSDRISTSNTFINNTQHINRTLLYKPYLVSMFHNNTKIHAFFG